MKKIAAGQRTIPFNTTRSFALSFERRHLLKSIYLIRQAVIGQLFLPSAFVALSYDINKWQTGLISFPKRRWQIFYWLISLDLGLEINPFQTWLYFCFLCFGAPAPCIPWYRRIPIITVPVIFVFSRTKGPLLSGSRYFRIVRFQTFVIQQWSYTKGTHNRHKKGHCMLVRVFIIHANKVNCNEKGSNVRILYVENIVRIIWQLWWHIHLLSVFMRFSHYVTRILCLWKYGTPLK